LEERKAVSGGDHPFFAAIYARLSVDSHSHKNESVETQIAIGEEFIRKYNEKIKENIQHFENDKFNKIVADNQGMQDSGYLKKIVLYGCYRDLGRSGTTFQREGFQQLMADIRSRKVNCVIVKDFSRFGRDYIETGNYIEKIFPMLGVRFISITDGYDSLQPMGEPEHMGMQLKNLVNELYARDISYRVKTAKQAKREQGGYTGGTPPYGYAIVREGGRRVLTPDPETAPILREIFKMYHQEKNAGSIIRGLYGRGIHRPKDARKYAHAFCQSGEILRAWDYEAIKFILQNELYRAGEGMVPVTEALVEGEVFDEIQEHFRENARRFSSVGAAGDRSTGLVYSNIRVDGLQTSGGWDASFERKMNPILVCGECGAAMERVSRRRGGTYHCRNGGRIDQLACQHKYISVQEVTRLLEMLEGLQWWLADISLADWDIYRRQSLEEQMNKCRWEIDKIEKKEQLMLHELSMQYSKYRGGELQKEKFLSYKEGREKEKIALTMEKNSWKQRLQKWKNRCKSDQNRENERHRSYFVTGMKLFPGKRMEIYYNYQLYNFVTEGRQTG
jgi:DNA invertase Pin-like site-specific DNA recombinase